MTQASGLLEGETAPLYLQQNYYTLTPCVYSFHNKKDKIFKYTDTQESVSALKRQTITLNKFYKVCLLT